MSIMDQINPPWQAEYIFVLFYVFETLCFPQCITDMSQLYSSSVNVRKLCKYIHFTVRSGRRLRSLHTESEIFVQNLCTLKNKYNLTLCQSRLHTACETFVRYKKIRIRFVLLHFYIRSMHFDRKG